MLGYSTDRPSKLVTHRHQSSEESRWDSPGRVEELFVGEEFLPVKDVTAGEETDDVGDDLVSSPAVDRCVRPGNKYSV